MSCGTVTDRLALGRAAEKDGKRYRQLADKPLIGSTWKFSLLQTLCLSVCAAKGVGITPRIDAHCVLVECLADKCDGCLDLLNLAHVSGLINMLAPPTGRNRSLYFHLPATLDSSQIHGASPVSLQFTKVNCLTLRGSAGPSIRRGKKRDEQNVLG